MFQTFFKKVSISFGVFFMALAIFCSFTLTSNGILDVPQAMASDHDKDHDKNDDHDKDKDDDDHKKDHDDDDDHDKKDKHGH